MPRSRNLAPGEGKAQEHDVARHVGDEDVPEHQIAEGIDQAGEECQAQEQRGSGPCLPLRSGTRSRARRRGRCSRSHPSLGVDDREILVSPSVGHSAMPRLDEALGQRQLDANRLGCIKGEIGVLDGRA